LKPVGNPPADIGHAEFALVGPVAHTTRSRARLIISSSSACLNEVARHPTAHHDFGYETAPCPGGRETTEVAEYKKIRRKRTIETSAGDVAGWGQLQEKHAIAPPFVPVYSQMGYKRHESRDFSGVDAAAAAFLALRHCASRDAAPL